MLAFVTSPLAAMIYCMEYLEKNFDWLKEKLESLPGCIDFLRCILCSSCLHDKHSTNVFRAADRYILASLT